MKPILLLTMVLQAAQPLIAGELSTEFKTASRDSGDVVVNEFLALNDSTIADQDGEYDDWIELYNNSDNTIELGGSYLSDDDTNPTKWVFPDTSIAPTGFLLIWADEDQEQDGLHTNFKLSGSGEVIIFLSPDQEVLDEVVFGAQVTDLSEGRYPDGGGDFVQMTPTPGDPNLGGVETIIEGDLQQPNDFTLLQIYPNPFNPATTISWILELPGAAQLTIYNTLGHQVRILAKGYYRAGRQEVTWDGNDSYGNRASSGLYFCSLQVGEQITTQKMLLLE